MYEIIYDYLGYYWLGACPTVTASSLKIGFGFSIDVTIICRLENMRIRSREKQSY
jgi:hypothetical protein